MATSASESVCENISTRKPVMFSESEIEAAEQLIQLSSGDYEDHHSSNNSGSYSVVQRTQLHQNNKVDSGCDVSSSNAATSIDDVMAEAEEDESFGRRKNKIRYRYIEDLYSVTKPVPEAKGKKLKYRN